MNNEYVQSVLQSQFMGIYFKDKAQVREGKNL